LPAWDIAEKVWWVSVDERWLECTALNEWHKNMGAYWYKPENIIVNKWSSLIKHKEKKTFTNYEMVYFELMGRDWKATVEWFKDKYGIEVKDIIKNESIAISHKSNNIDGGLSELLINKTPFSWWLPSVDEMFWRYNYECLNLIVWESWHWKTEFALQQAEVNSQSHKIKYLLLEGSKEELARRRWRKRALISIAEWDDRSFGDNKRELFIEEYKRIMWLEFIESWEYNLNWVVEYIRQEASKWIRLFYIDNLWFIIKDPKLNNQCNSWSNHPDSLFASL
jgi:hypothetical protein